jgi:hypothetical protein
MSVSVTQEHERHKRPKLGYLRIAFSAVCGIACVLLIALWIRSYWIADGFGKADSWHVVSLRGELLVSFLDDKTGFVTVQGGYFAEKISEEFDSWNLNAAATPTWDIFFARGANLPGWFHTIGVKFLTLLIIPLVLAVSTCPWIHLSQRFSLRTLLLATTVVALILGIIAMSI